jgi:phage host-nuclease inhibitor protein Gam
VIDTPAVADAWLRKKGLAEIEIDRIEADLNEKIATLKERAVKEAAEHQAVVRMADEALEAFWQRQYKPGGAKSMTLTFGVLGARASRAVKLLRPLADVIEALGSGFAKFLRVKQTVNKEALLDASAEELRELRRYLEIEPRETFYAEPDREAIARDRAA